MRPGLGAGLFEDREHHGPEASLELRLEQNVTEHLCHKVRPQPECAAAEGSEHHGVVAGGESGGVYRTYLG